MASSWQENPVATQTPKIEYEREELSPAYECGVVGKVRIPRYCGQYHFVQHGCATPRREASMRGTTNIVKTFNPIGCQNASFLATITFLLRLGLFWHFNRMHLKRDTAYRRKRCCRAMHCSIPLHVRVKLNNVLVRDPCCAETHTQAAHERKLAREICNGGMRCLTALREYIYRLGPSGNDFLTDRQVRPTSHTVLLRFSES